MGVGLAGRARTVARRGPGACGVPVGVGSPATGGARGVRGGAARASWADHGAGGAGVSAVACDGLVVRFGSLTAVDGASLSVERGEVFGLLGPNGAGKTTTLRVLTTLLRADAGSASVAGWDVRCEGLEVRASIGYVPQALSAEGALTARENLDFYARVTGVPRGERAARIAAAVEAMELEALLD